MPSNRSDRSLSRRAPARRLFTIVPFAALVAAGAVVGAVRHVSNGVAAIPVHPAGLILDGKSPDESKSALQSWAAERNSARFTLHIDPATSITRVWQPPASKLGLSVNVGAAIRSAADAANGGVTARLVHWVSGGQSLAPPQAQVDRPKLESYLNHQIAHDIGRPARRASVRPAGSSFTIHAGADGLALDVQRSADAITAAWNAYVSAVPTSAAAPPASPDVQPPGSPSGAAPAAATLEVTLPVVVTHPDLVENDLKAMDGVLASFSTHYRGTSNRRSNIVLATRKINGTLLRPGEIFSYNRVVGPRSGDAGFLPAPQYVHGKHVMGEGGGICQVSSTLFNAALLSNLKIVRRQNHSMPVAYLKHGRDATAVYGAIDMQFQNNTSAPIYIASATKGGMVEFTFYGKRTPGREVSYVKGKETIRPAPVELHHDARLAAGRRITQEKGSPGINVVWYRVVKENGQVVSRQPFVSRYHAFPRIVVLGTKARAPKPAGIAPPDGSVPAAPPPDPGAVPTPPTP